MTDLARSLPLRAAREARGMTLRAAARSSRIDPGHLSKVERGEKQLSIDSLYRLSVVLEMKELTVLIRPYISTKEAA
ncbi:helix-turn-helix domain-containing protein [Streptomyces griseus]|uniref:helix-turn-helix domain-containing protein n=1 Tax=Streptomyces griseus TaxID=1911 RepID=UPI0033B3C3B2